jgi:hypothetical protein
MIQKTNLNKLYRYGEFHAESKLQPRYNDDVLLFSTVHTA